MTGKHNSNKDSEDPQELALSIYRLSNQAFELAQEFATAKGDKANLKKKAEEIDKQLEEMQPLIQHTPPSEQPTVNMKWADARLDVGYILTDGDLSTSTRLFYFLEDLKTQQ